MARKKLYFARPLNTYGQLIEVKMIELIKETFPQFDIEDPNQTKHQEGYIEWKERNKNNPGKSGMNYFYDEVLPQCWNVVAWPFLDGKIGAGVAGESLYFIEKGKWPHIIKAPRLKAIRPLDLEEMEALIAWEKMKNTATSKEVLEMVENEFVLSIETTRKRTWEILYEEYLPYEESHLII